MSRSLLIVLCACLLNACAGNPARSQTTPPVDASPTAQTTTLQATPLPFSPLRDSIIAAGDYLVRGQLSDGELPYQVHVLTGGRDFAASEIRLVAGTGALYTVCRVAADPAYCDAGDLALDHYLDSLIESPKDFDGLCLYSGTDCPLGGAALAVDSIYRRWKVTGNFELGARDLLETARRLGGFLVWMRRPEGGFYHRFDPHAGGGADPNYYVVYFPGESLLALTELYEMTGDPAWLTQAREVDAYMLTRPVTEDHWHAYAFANLARLDGLSEDDRAYARRIAETVIAGQPISLAPGNSSVSAATKLEALAGLARAFAQDGDPQEWLVPEMKKFSLFVLARQLPSANCDWAVTQEMAIKFLGGIYSSCVDPSIRVDGQQHWINGAASYLDYLQLSGNP